MILPERIGRDGKEMMIYTSKWTVDSGQSSDTNNPDGCNLP